MATTFTARDGVRHAPSQDPDVHRPLIAVDPPLQGRDVANVQRAAKARLENRGIGAGKVPVPQHGKFTVATALACIEAQYFLGLRSDTYLMRDVHGHVVLTEGAQAIIRRPETRTAEQLERAKARAAQAAQGPRYYAELAAKMGLGGGRGPQAALAYAGKHVGVREQPPNSNSGPTIDDWLNLTGYGGPQPWCGCFVNACVVAAGVPSGAGWIGYTPAIVAHAKARKGGWSWHATGEPGDLALFDTPGGDPAVHVEIVRERLSPVRYSTFGGNTSAGSSGSQANGGVVARHDDRTTSGNFRIIGFARPPYPA